MSVVQTITQQTTPADHLKRDVSYKLSMLDPARFALDTFLRRMKSGEAAKQIKVEWAQLRSLPRKTQLNGAVAEGAAAATAAWVVDDVTMWRKEDLIMVISNGVPATDKPIMIVENINTGTSTLTVRALAASGFGTVPAVADDQVIAWIGNAKAEKGHASTERASTPGYDFNYVETFDAVVKMSKTRKYTQNYTKEHDWTVQQRQQLVEFRRSTNYKNWFGDLSLTDDKVSGSATEDEKRYTMKGLARFITKTPKTYTIANGIEESDIIDWLTEAYSANNGSETRFFFTDLKMAAEITKARIASLQSRRTEKVLGLKCDVLEFQIGQVYMVYEPSFDYMGLSHYGVLVDLEQVEKRVLRPMERIPLMLDKIGQDVIAEQVIEASTICVFNPDAHLVVKGV